MSDNNWDIDVDSEQFEDAPKALRDAYKNLKKQFGSVTTERDDFRGKWQSLAIAGSLSDQNFKNPERVKRDLLSDKVDLSDTEAVKSWLSENGDDYARGEGGASQATTEQNVDHGDEAAARQQLAAAQSAVTQPAHTDKLKAALAEITPEMDGAAVAAVYKKHGV